MAQFHTPEVAWFTAWWWEGCSRQAQQLPLRESWQRNLKTCTRHSHNLKLHVLLANVLKQYYRRCGDFLLTYWSSTTGGVFLLTYWSSTTGGGDFLLTYWSSTTGGGDFLLTYWSSTTGSGDFLLTCQLKQYYKRWGLLANIKAVLQEVKKLLANILKQYYRWRLLAKQYYRWRLLANILKQYYRWGLLANILKQYYRWGLLANIEAVLYVETSC